MNIEILKQSGINYESGLKRFLGDAQLYDQLLESFLADTVLERAQQALNNGNMGLLENTVHEMKGVSGNMDMTDLYKSSTDLVSMLRQGGYDDAALKDTFARFSAAYLRIKDGINQAK